MMRKRRAAWSGIVGFAATIPYLVLQLPAGVLVDRVDRRRAMLACDAGRLVVLAGAHLSPIASRIPGPILGADATDRFS